TGSGSSYTVTVNAGASDGRIALQLNDDDTIINSGSTPLGTTGTGNGDYFDGAQYVIDHTAPTVASVATTPTIGSLTNVTSIQIDVTMSNNVTGFASGDVTVTSGGTAAVGSITVSTISATVLRATLSGLSGSGFLSVSLVAGAVADAAGNTNADATILNTNLDTDSATVTSITPVTATPTNADSVVFTVMFGESVSGFDSAGDVTVNLTGAVTTGTPTIVAAPAMPYTVTVPNITGDGTISLSVNAAAAIDVVGNANLAGGPSAAITIDNTPPTIQAIDVATLDLGSAESASATVTFSEAVSGFDAADVTVTHSGTTSDTPTVTATSASVYEITINNLIGSGEFTVSIAASAANDAAGYTVESGVTSDSISRKAPDLPAEGEELPDAKSPDDDVIAIPGTDVDGDTADADGDADPLGSATECGAGGCGAVGLSQLLMLSGLIAMQRRRRPLYHSQS
ncbi:MAG: Ig-like domain-containing protein, partial [Phycisphaerae bacterium]